MKFKDVDLFGLQRSLWKGIPSGEMKKMFPLSLAPAWTVENYVLDMMALGNIVEKEGVFRSTVFPAVHPENRL